MKKLDKRLTITKETLARVRGGAIALSVTCDACPASPTGATAVGIFHRPETLTTIGFTANVFCRGLVGS
jgi:hypothetical protein